MTSTEKKYHRKEIAARQLQTAITLLLNNKSPPSVITLAGAASNILGQLVRNAGKEPFIDYAREIHNFHKGSIPPREKYQHYIDKMLGIISLKHLSPSDSETITLDLEQCAIDTIVRATADYTTLYGQEETFIKNFFA